MRLVISGGIASEGGGRVGSDRAQWASVAVSSIAVFLSAGTLAVTLQTKGDTEELRAKDSREGQIKNITYSYGDREFVVTNRSDGPIKGLVVRFAYAPKEYRYVVLKGSLESGERWFLNDKNLQAADDKLPALPGDSTKFVTTSDQENVEVSLTDFHGAVWDLSSKGSRQRGYWKTGFNTDSQSGSFIQNRTELPQSTVRPLDGKATEAADQ
ncbi:hypothetical protein OG302_00900 [Streptomyces sp. NBC_01283]|uniref:hypothetical protein n=1 Tax=Streptomyces sp. NBC_01283 TaxID=2903812 RepID=UPI00352ED55E|nr:hypothetical protein OG302_00900 [Streptomyces sp. NBC_01283]